MNGADKDFPANAWCKLLPQVTMNINMNRASQINKNRSAYEELKGTFDFNATPLAPLGTKLILYIPAEARQTTYSDHGKLGWYVGPVLDKYRNYSIWMEHTKDTMESNQIEFFTTKYQLPNRTPIDRLSTALENLTKELQNDTPITELEPGTLTNKAIKTLKTWLYSQSAPQGLAERGPLCRHA